MMKPLRQFLADLIKPPMKIYEMGGLLFIFAAMINPQCQQSIKQKLHFPYNLTKPDKEFILEKKLTEVSGLSFISSHEVALIQDEIGTIFIYDLNKNAITKNITFSKKGDFEDLKVFGDSAFVLRSDGSLVYVSGLSGEVKQQNINTALSGGNDTEGLCYDEIKNLLLIACKGKPHINKQGRNMDDKKAIYSFDPVTQTLSDTPYVLIDVSEIENISRGTYSNVIEKLVRFYTQAGVVQSFEPSGISIHPLTRELYVIASVGKILVTIDTTGQLSNVIKLDPETFKQPEGIAFDSSGSLYISNEGRNGKGNILKFSQIKPIRNIPGL